ncbi:hypothetical protein EON63_22780, partial [archaeon]
MCTIPTTRATVIILITTMGTTPNPTPTRVGTATYTQVAAGFEFTLGLRADGSLYAWGINGAGQLGSTINVGMGKANPTPLQ